MLPLLLLALSQVTTSQLLMERLRYRGLDRLTQTADYRSVQFSSWDRGSLDRGNWFANDDRGHYLRVEDGEYVMAECEGPGALVRIWSANPAGTLRLRLDGKLVLEADFRALLAGEVEGFEPPYAAFRSRGGNLYYPFAFAKSLKLSCTEGGQYYHAQVRRYAAGTVVETWERPIDWLNVERRSTTPSDEPIVRGCGVVHWLEIPLPDDPAVLRSEMLRIYCDDELTVRCPLGDFFGTAPGRNTYATIPMAIREDGVGCCFFSMPFGREFRVETSRPVRIGYRTEEVDRGTRFYAFWRGDNHLQTRPMRDWPVLNVRGKGRFVGCSLTVRNPVKGWWGEGDEKVYVDGEKFPSFFGTGTEDYFGYAWCDPTPFEAPFHAQSRCDGPGNRGYTSLARFHVIDDIPFTTSLRFDMEVWHWVDCEIGFSTVAYWYAEPGCRHDFAEPFPDDLEVLSLPEAPGVAGAIEGERMQIAAKTGGNPASQDLEGIADGASRGEHLWWRDANLGDSLTLGFESARASRSIALRFTRAPDYGIVKLELNGKPLASDVDLYADRVIVGTEEVFDAAVLEGANVLVVTITGDNAKARPKNHMFGLDYVRIP